MMVEKSGGLAPRKEPGAQAILRKMEPVGSTLSNWETRRTYLPWERRWGFTSKLLGSGESFLGLLCSMLCVRVAQMEGGSDVSL